MGASSPRRRLVDEYVQVEPNGPYKLARHDIEFSQYLKDEGYKIIPCTEEMQFRYGCNGLNLGRNSSFPCALTPVCVILIILFF
jgi:hypothetical protein